MFRHVTRIIFAGMVMTLLASGLFAQAPPAITRVVNFGDLSTRLCPGVGAFIFGARMGPNTTQAAPAGLTVTVGGQNATVAFGNGGLLAIVIPAGLSPGTANVVVTYQGRVSPSFTITLDAAAPTIVLEGVPNKSGPMCGNRTAERFPLPGDVINCAAMGLGQAGAPTVSVGGVPATGVAVVPAGFNAPGISAIDFVVPDLAPGTYPVVVRVGAFSSNTIQVPVSSQPGIIVSQTGFTFQAIQGGGAPSPNQLRVQNTGGAPQNFQITTITTSGGNFVAVDLSNGQIQPGAEATINVSVVPGALTPGDYYGQVRIDAPGAVNSPQFVSVVLSVSPASATVPPVVEPVGLVFVRLNNGPNPAAQSFRITNLRNVAVPFATATDFFGGQRWFSVAPANGNVAPGQPVTINVTADVALATGVYPGRITVNFPQDNFTAVVTLVLVVTPEITLSARKDARRDAGLCNPTRLIPVFSSLGANFSARTAFSTPIEVLVVDDCGSAMRNGSVVASFSNGDDPIPLVSTVAAEGRWSATWVPQRATANTQVTVTARQGDRNLQGVATVGGSVPQNNDTPVVFSNGVLSAASFSRKAQPSPGEFVAIFGSRLADGVEVATAVPLPTQLGATSVIMAGRQLPLLSVSDTQINAVIPYEVGAPAGQQLIVRRGNRASSPTAVTVLSAQPGVYTINNNGQGQGHIYGGPSQQTLASPANPASAGDVLVIYCNGLGAVAPTVAAGSATPGDALRETTNRLTATIGGKEARVAFAGLTPGAAALYQVNLTVPEGVEPGDAVPVVLTVAGVSSPPVTIAVR